MSNNLWFGSCRSADCENILNPEAVKHISHLLSSVQINLWLKAAKSFSVVIDHVKAVFWDNRQFNDRIKKKKKASWHEWMDESTTVLNDVFLLQI